MTDDETIIEPMPTVPAESKRWICILVLPEEQRSGTYRNLVRLAALGTVITGAVITAGALLIWMPLGIGLVIVFSLIVWGIFRLSRAGLAKQRLSGDSEEADRLLDFAPQLRYHASRRKVREWIGKLPTALPAGSIVRLCHQKSSEIRAYSAPFEPFSVNCLPEWVYGDFEGGDSIDLEKESEFLADEQAKQRAKSKIRRLLGAIGSSAAGVFAVTVLLAFLAFILGLIGYLTWLSFMAIVDLVLYRKPPKFPLIVYFLGAVAGISVLYNFLLSFRQIWMVPGGFVRRTSRPWRRRWDIELFKQRDCILVLDETMEKFGSYALSANRIIRMDFGLLGPAGSLGALLSPIPPPDVTELSDLH